MAPLSKAEGLSLKALYLKGSPSAALRETIGKDKPPYGLRTITHEGYNNMRGTP